MKSTQHYHKQKGSIVPELILMFPAFIPALMASLASEPLLDPAVLKTAIVYNFLTLGNQVALCFII